MEHKHGPNCGCKEYANVENASDLFEAIDLSGIICLNESQDGKGRSVFKAEENKLDHNDFVESDDPDPEMIFIIPFIFEVKLKAICIIAKDSEVAPNFLKVYINQENVDFSIAEGKGLENTNKEKIGISYIGMKGDMTTLKRQIVNAVYEIKPLAAQQHPGILKDAMKEQF